MERVHEEGVQGERVHGEGERVTWGQRAPFKTQYLCRWVLISKDRIAVLLVRLLLLASIWSVFSLAH